MSATPAPRTGLPEAASLQPMQDADLEEVARIEARNYEFPWTRGNFADSLAAGHSAWVLRNRGGMLGYAVLMRVLDEAHLLNITIDVEWRGAGRGRQLLVGLCEMSRQAGARQFFLEVRPSNTAALALYESAGFVRVGTRRGYYPARDGREDAIVMVKPL